MNTQEALKIYAKAVYSLDSKLIHIFDEDESTWHGDNICFTINQNGEIINVELIKHE